MFGKLQVCNLPFEEVAAVCNAAAILEAKSVHRPVSQLAIRTGHKLFEDRTEVGQLKSEQTGAKVKKQGLVTTFINIIFTDVNRE